MAALALKQTAEIYETTPAKHSLEVNTAADVKKVVDGMEKLVRARKQRAILERATLNATFEAFQRNVPSELFAQLDETIALISEQIADHRDYVAKVEGDSREMLQDIKGLNEGAYKNAKKQLSRFVDLGHEMHNDAVELYYFALIYVTKVSAVVVSRMLK